MSKIDVKSEITGNVSRIEKVAGDAVAEDEDIVILESMKMEPTLPLFFIGEPEAQINPQGSGESNVEVF